MLEVFVLEFKQNKQLSKSFYLPYWFQFNKQITYINIMMQTNNIMPKDDPYFRASEKVIRASVFSTH